MYTGDACKEILRLSRLRNGIVDDMQELFDDLSFPRQMCAGDSPIIFELNEEIRLCAGRPYKTAFIIDSESSDFDSTFTDFVDGFQIEDASDEEQCRYARESLRFDPEYIDDEEICSELADIKCGLNPMRLQLLRGGDYEELDEIPEFEEFGFEGFAPDTELPFRDVEPTPMEKAEKRE